MPPTRCVEHRAAEIVVAVILSYASRIADQAQRANEGLEEAAILELPKTAAMIRDTREGALIHHDFLRAQ